MATKTNTQLFFDEIIKDIHYLLKPLGFKKKALNFYRAKDGFHQLINIQKSAYNSADSICFTMNICTDFAKENDTTFPTMLDLLVRERIGRISGNTDIWYDLDGEMPDIFKRKQRFSQMKQEVLHDIENIALPFFEKMNTRQKIEKFYQEKYGQ